MVEFSTMQPHIKFHFIPNQKLAIVWSQKCACGAIASWTKQAIRPIDDFDNSPDPIFGANARLNLQHRGYNFHLYNLNALTKLNLVNAVAVATRDPLSRMRSAFLNKFLIYRKKEIRKFSKLELFSQNFLKLAEKTPLQVLPNSIQFMEKNNSFVISMASFIEAIAVEEQIRLIDGHFKPQLTEKRHLETISKLDNKIPIFPLRTEFLSDDFMELNKFLGLDYVPPKDNVSDLPEGWRYSDLSESVAMSNQDLIRSKIVPTKNALQKWIETNTEVKNSFLKRFKWDYQLREYLDGKLTLDK